MNLIEDCKKNQQPCLVGTVSIEKSEKISSLLKSRKIPHEVLNAKNHLKEADIIANAGKPGQITIATNMAGRGTDIKLGGVEENKENESLKKIALDSGGLYIIGTERHESRRIDNQLRGRSGRQGDPGSSKFFLSLEDDLMRILALKNLTQYYKLLDLRKMNVSNILDNKSSGKSPKKVEGRNFEIRKSLLRFDDDE